MSIQSSDDKLLEITRRHFFKQCGVGVGSMASSSLLNENLFARGGNFAQAGSFAQARNGADFKGPHFPPRAKSIIYLFMAGAPSQLDLFDYKPKLNQYDGQPCPEELIKGERFAFIKGVPRLLGSPHVFGKYGQSGAELSNLLPHLGTIADDIAIVKSMHTTQFNHAPAQLLMNTGHQ